MALKTERLDNNYDLFKVMRNEKVLKKGSSGDGVRLMQACLISLGYPLPVSVSKQGSPDGLYGKETADAVRRFQIQCKLAVDGKIGPQTLKTIDGFMETVDINLPPVKSRIPCIHSYVEPIKQIKNGCWATAYAILKNWKNQSSLPVRNHIQALGKKWLDFYDAEEGLSAIDHIPFANAAKLRYEPFVCVTAEDVAQLLFDHGPLLIAYGWQRLRETSAPGKAGHHVIVLWAIAGDGTPDKTWLSYTDPQEGTEKSVTFQQFMDMYELGFLLRSDYDHSLVGYTQIMHF